MQTIEATAAAPEYSWLSEQKDLLRFSTAGSVDDGKSTLIGRLLYDSKGVYEDQISSVRKASENRMAEPGTLDFSLLTDGLRAEREQGITIDVAYRYFATAKRKFIIADTPGHEQYTRNMATGASTADLAVVLIDARKGVLPQSRRHAFIASMLGISHIVVAVNKMDLVGFSREVFEQIRWEFTRFATHLNIAHLHFIPLSALLGDNVVSRSPNMPWFTGASLIEYLETVPIPGARAEEMRFPVQYVIRPTLDFRGYAGQLASGILRKGETVVVLPSERRSRVKSIVSYDGDLEEAWAPMSVTVCLEDEIDISRGDMLVHENDLPFTAQRVEAKLVWMAAEALQPGTEWILKQTTRMLRATLTGIEHRVDVNTLEQMPAEQLEMNEIGRVTIDAHKTLFFDPYRVNRGTGAFILIHPVTNGTVAAGMIVGPAEEGGFQFEPVSDQERRTRYGHQAIAIAVPGRPRVARIVERMLFDRKCLVYVYEGTPAVRDLELLEAAGLIVLCTGAGSEEHDMYVPELTPDDHESAKQICGELERRGFLD